MTGIDEAILCIKEAKNTIISSLDETASPVECVFNTMPKSLFHRARLFNEVNVQKSEPRGMCFQHNAEGIIPQGESKRIGYFVPVP